MYLMIAICVLVFLYTVYLVTRLWMPRIPEQIGLYSPGLGAGLGVLMVHGQGLQLKELSVEGGQTCVEGTISALVYEEPRQGGWLRRLMG